MKNLLENIISQMTSLNQIVKLDEFKSLAKDQIEFLWLAKHQSADSSNTTVASVIDYETLKPLLVLAVKNNQFIIPVANEASKQLDFHYIQWNNISDTTLQCAVIKLLDFQQSGLAARPHSTIFFYKDLVSDKGVVLMRGEILNSQEFKVNQLQTLILNIQKFYGILDPGNKSLQNQRLRQLTLFNKGDPEFDYQAVIDLTLNTK